MEVTDVDALVVFSLVIGVAPLLLDVVLLVVGVDELPMVLWVTGVALVLLGILLGVVLTMVMCCWT